MSRARFIHKVDQLADIRYLPNAAGIGQFGGSLFANVDGILLPIGDPAAGIGRNWYVDTNVGSNSNSGRALGSPFLTMGAAFGNLGPRDTVFWRGNVIEQLTSPLGAPDVTLVGLGTRPRHADTHPLYGEKSGATWKIGSLGNAPLLTIRTPGWRVINGLFAAHASNYAIKLQRTGIEDATEEDASHSEFVGCRFASGAGGITDVGGCFDIAVEDCWFQAVTAACILGVGNIGVGQLMWHIRGNHFNNFVNGVKIAAHECLITRNFFTDGGTPGATFVLNTNNGGGRDNFVVDNYFQVNHAHWSTPDIVGCATDVWVNENIDGSDTTGREVGPT